MISPDHIPPARPQVQFLRACSVLTLTTPMQTNTMRELVIESLTADLPRNCEWGSVLFDVPGVPMTTDGFIDYDNFPPELLQSFSDDLLLRLFDANACLRYR